MKRESIMKLFIILLMFSGLANAGMYKCKDANGKISYSQKRCEVVEDIQVLEIHEESDEAKDRREINADAKASRERIAESERMRAERKHKQETDYKTAKLKAIEAKYNAKAEEQRSFQKMNEAAARSRESNDRLIRGLLGRR